VPPPTNNPCYSGNNDISGMSVQSLSIDDSYPYSLGGDGITLGAGGGTTITATPSNATNGFGASLGFPITLGAAQTWSINGDPHNGFSLLDFVGHVTGSSRALNIDLGPAAFLTLGGGTEVGTLTVTGSDVVNRPVPEVSFISDVNSTDGNAVSATGVVMPLLNDAAFGPLTLVSDELQVGTGTRGATVTINGGLSIDSTSFTQFFINGHGSTAGVDYSQLSATGNVSLAGAFGVGTVGSPVGCLQLSIGTVYTLITTTGTVSGTFTGVPDGTVVHGCGPGSGPGLRINYTQHTVTATVVSAGGAPTSTSLAASPSTPVTNQAVTLTATVSASSGNPSGGTVAFGNGGGPISGCESQPVSWSGATGTAVCQTSFAADSSPEQLIALFVPSDPSLQRSFSQPDQLAVGTDSTATALAASNASPAPGQSVTYTATVTPLHSGAAEPSGSVTFLDGATAIGSCASQPLTVGASSFTATCTVSYPAAGSHSVVASYAGDANFAGSTSSPVTVSVQSPAPPSSAGSGVGASGSPPSATITPSSAPSAAQIAAALSGVLAPHGKAATIAALLAHGGYRLTFQAPGPGALEITWYFVPKGAHLAKAHRPPPVAIATAHVGFTSAGRAQVTLRLSATGRQILRHARALPIQVRASYTPTGGNPTVETKRLTLKRSR
jgi:hypothetical protein